MRKLLLTTIFILFFAVSVHGATYNYYFSNTPTGTEDCSLGNACAGTLGSGGTIQALIDAAGSTDIVNLYFDRGSTWTANSETAGCTTYGIDIGTTDPIVNIDAYGSGDKPIFDGLVTDFSAVNEHDASTYCRYNRMIQIVRDDCSIKNIKITKVYGKAIWIGNVSTYADNITIQNCDFTNIGMNSIDTSAYVTRNSTYSKNLFHTTGQLSRYELDGGGGVTPTWGPNISFQGGGTPTRFGSGNTVEYNVMYDIWGEGISGAGYTAQYNVIGDTASSSIFFQPAAGSPVEGVIIRYNLLVQSDGTDYDSTDLGGNCDGIDIGDDNTSGSNASADIEVYGNVIIHKRYGINFHPKSSGSNSINSVRIYNNTIISSTLFNIILTSGYFDNVKAGGGYIYNNASILYGPLTGNKQATDQSAASLSTYWAISHNSYWEETAGGGGTVDGVAAASASDWNSNYQVTNPLLYGEETAGVDWDNITENQNPTSEVDFDDAVPQTGSSLIDNGTDPGGSDNLLPNTATFANLPDTVTSFSPLVNNLTYGSSPYYEIGAAVYETGGQVSSYPTPSNINSGNLSISNINSGNLSITVNP